MSEPEIPAAPPPPPPPPEEPTGTHAGNQWERRSELGFAQSIVDTVKGFIMAPGDTFMQTRKSGDMASPILFAVILSVVGALVEQVWSMLFGTSLLSMVPMEYREGLGFLMMSSGAGFLASLFLVPIFTVIGIFIWGAIVHVLLMLVGGLDESDAGFEGSIRVVSYSSVANLAKMIPFIGGMVSMIWMIVLMVIGINRLHGTSEGKAVAAVLLPLVLCCVCVGIMVMVGAGAMLSGLAAE